MVISLYLNGFMNACCEYGEYAYVLTADNLSIDEVCMIFDSIGAIDVKKFRRALYGCKNYSGECVWGG